jgi:hypothetical protein
MRPVRYESNHNGAREQKALGRIQIKDRVIQDLDACGFLYQTGDDIDEQKVDD